VTRVTNRVKTGKLFANIQQFYSGELSVEFLVLSFELGRISTNSRRGVKAKIRILKKFFIPLPPVAYALGSVDFFTNFRIKRAGSSNYRRVVSLQ
jgi:hypothetical protein